MLAEFGVEVNETGSINVDLGGAYEEYHMKTELDHIEEDNEHMALYGRTLSAIDSLKDNYKDILVDRLLNDMKYEDIAEKHNLPLQTIKNRIHRGKALISESVLA